MGIWNEWRYNRLIYYGIPIPEIETLSSTEIADYLCKFVLEIRKKNGDEFPPNSLHHILCGIQRYLRINGKPSIDFFKDPAFANFKLSLDAEMKRLQKLGLGSKKRQAEPLTIEEEELLWSTGLLGCSSPQTLVDTMVFMTGLYFALRSGDKHRQLRFEPCQIELVERSGERPHLVYTEDISKNRPGGIKGRKVKPKVVLHHANLENPDRCFVRIFKLYNSLCPENRPNNAFYLKPLQKPKPGAHWFSAKPLGRNTLEGTVARLCREAAIPGFKTNHSLRATTATRLYQAGVDEQLVME
ncbi:transcriptional regulator QRICH1-like [Halichondria panicea]|uniref:transcriptional regulator QRICH1-like n=1 Tax=Halichondria panicea TaxID=6063 RepID=UPI00312BBFC8